MKITMRIDTPFTQVSNILVADKSLTLKAKGLYLYICSKPGTWDFSAKRIALDCKDGADSVMSGLKELEDSGYLLREKNNDGTVDYTVLWAPEQENPVQPKRENPIQGNSLTGILPTISNKDSIVIKNDSNKELEDDFKKSMTQAVMGEFLKVNRAMKGMMGWKVERESALALAGIIGPQNIKEYISFIPRLVEFVDDPKFVPDCTKPSSMLRNFTKFEKYYKLSKVEAGNGFKL